MFSLHETTQRRVCRTAFVAGCVLPTLCAVVWAVFLHRPWRENDWQQTLREQLHVQATIGEVSSPYPGVTQLQQVQFADLRTERLLGSIGELRIEGWKSLLVADRIEISAAQLPELATAIATWVSSEELPALQLQAEAVHFVGPDGESFELKNFRLQSLVSSDSHKQIELQAEPSSAKHGGTIRLSVEHHASALSELKIGVRDIQSHLAKGSPDVSNPNSKSCQSTRQAEPTVFVQLDTHGEHLPAWLLSELVPGLKGCSSAQFAGQLEIESLSQTVSGSMSGRLDGIDLKQWVDVAGSYRLEGIASLQIEDLQWTNHRLSLLQGRLLAGNGRVSHSLLATLSKKHYFSLGQELAGAVNSADLMHAFDELAFNFQISSEGVAISGACETCKHGSGGCLVALNGQPLLLQPKYRTLQVARLIQVFTPMQPGASWLPATLEASEMADGLPLPSVLPGPRGGPATRGE